MRAKYARLIRIGINAKCVPYTSGGSPDEGYWTVYDFRRAREYTKAWNENKDIPLVKAAARRTKLWTSTRECEGHAIADEASVQDLVDDATRVARAEQQQRRDRNKVRR